ncbi:MAG TPA: superoxide dismutase [Opitutaceae bacterium]|nr:superoxide dismutase [Opitutaceae bacterium]
MNPHPPLTRRGALKAMGAGAAVIGLSALSVRGATTAKVAATPQPFTLPKLDYAYNALEPHIDAQTMEIHLTKHHQAYITNATKALAEHSALQKMSAEEILRNLSSAPEAIRTPLRNNVGGHVNHAFFWKVIGPNGGGVPGGPLGEAITKTFGSFDAFKTQFADAAAKRFGSGWAWLVAKEGKLSITSTANQDSPISDGATPVLGLDVWEHAYYLQYQNRRPDYVNAFWNVVSWKQAAANFAA